MNQPNFKFEYMFLGRLKMDLDYYFGYGKGCVKHLYYGSIEEHVLETRKLWSSFPDNLKPLWFTQQDLVRYESLAVAG